MENSKKHIYHFRKNVKREGMVQDGSRDKQENTRKKVFRFLLLAAQLSALGLNGIEKCALICRMDQRIFPADVYAVLGKADRPDGGFGEWVREKALELVPRLYPYTEDQPCQEEAIEDGDTVAMILEAQSKRRKRKPLMKRRGRNGDRKQRIGCGPTRRRHPMDKLRDFEYLLSNYYTVDSSTVIRAGTAQCR